MFGTTQDFLNYCVERNLWKLKKIEELDTFFGIRHQGIFDILWINAKNSTSFSTFIKKNKCF